MYLASSFIMKKTLWWSYADNSPSWQVIYGICPICGGKLHLHHGTPKGFYVYICECKYPNRTFNNTRETIFRNASLPIWKLALM
jgi:hypothetical protein